MGKEIELGTAGGSSYVRVNSPIPDPPLRNNGITLRVAVVSPYFLLLSLYQTSFAPNLC